MKCWILDSESDVTYGNLALSFPAEEFLVLDAQDIHCSLLQGPPGVPVEVWDEHFKRMFCQTCFVREGGSAMVTVLLNSCRQEMPGRPIAIQHLYGKLIALRYKILEKGREYSYFEVAKNRLQALQAVEMFKCLVGFDWAYLTSKNVLFRLKGLGTSDYELFTNYLLCYLASFFEPGLPTVPKLIVVVEETHRLTHPQRLKRVDNAEPIILDMTRTLGKRGVALVFVDQVPYTLPLEILANTGLRCVFGTIEGRNLSALQQSLSLTLEQRAFLSRLPKRACVVQYNNPKSPKPFVVLVDEFPMSEDIEPEIEERRNASLRQLSWLALDVPVSPIGEPRERSPLVSKPAIDYLAEIAKDQFVPVSWRDRDQGIPVGSGSELRKELQRAGLIALETVDTYSRSKKIRNTRITDKGYGLLKQMKVPHERPRGRGGWPHLYYQNLIAKWAQQNGYQALAEHPVEGKAVDVSLEKENKRIAVEILCHGVIKELNNLRDLSVGYEEIWFCVKDLREGKRLEELIRLKFEDEADAILAATKFKLLGLFQDTRSEEGSE